MFKKIILSTLACLTLVQCNTLKSDCEALAEREAQIAQEQAGDYYIGRRYYIPYTRFWGYLRKPGQSWRTAQLVMMDEINEDRRNSFNTYMELLAPLKQQGFIDLPVIPEECEGNGHMFYVMCKDLDERERLQRYLRQYSIGSAFHYVPLHSAPEGERAGRMASEDRYTTNVFERLLRLPMFYRLNREQIEEVCGVITRFYKEKNVFP